jgi:hypothetical protein
MCHPPGALYFSYELTPDRSRWRKQPSDCFERDTMLKAFVPSPVNLSHAPAPDKRLDPETIKKKLAGPKHSRDFESHWLVKIILLICAPVMLPKPEHHSAHLFVGLGCEKTSFVCTGQKTVEEFGHSIPMEFVHSEKIHVHGRHKLNLG